MSDVQAVNTLESFAAREVAMGGPDGRGKAVKKLKITRQNKIMSTPAVRHRIKSRNHLIQIQKFQNIKFKMFIKQTKVSLYV